jgi:hypothetical protein
MEKLYKYEIGDIVCLKNSVNRFVRILEIHIDIFEDGKKVIYDGRVLDSLGIGKVSRFCSSELYCIPKNINNVINEVYNNIINFSDKKIKAINDKDFETAALYRDKEKEYLKELEVYEGIFPINV